MTPDDGESAAFWAYLANFVNSDVFAALVVALVSSWGAVLITERWDRKRERVAEQRSRCEAKQSRLLDHVTELVKWYHVNVRLLRQDPAARNDVDLNMAHASFLAHTKLLAMEPRLKDHTDKMNDVAWKMSQLWPAHLKKPSRDAGLQKIYEDFREALDSLTEEIDKIGLDDRG